MKTILKLLTERRSNQIDAMAFVVFGEMIGFGYGWVSYLVLLTIIPSVILERLAKRMGV